MYNIDLIVHNYANYAKYTLTDSFLNELYKLYTIQVYNITVPMYTIDLIVHNYAKYTLMNFYAIHYNLLQLYSIPVHNVYHRSNYA